MAAAAFLCAGVVIGLASMDTSALDMSDAFSAVVISILSLSLIPKTV